MSIEQGNQELSQDESEVIFKEYLRTIGCSYDYEHEICGKHPDFWIPSSEAPEVVCEVTQIKKRLPCPVGSFDGPQPVKTKLKKKAAQGKSLGEKGIPYVVVLHSWSWPLNDVTVPSAMFGEMGISILFDPVEGAFNADEAESVFGRDAELQYDQHTQISAVAVLELFNPTLGAMEAVIDERLGSSQQNRGDLTEITRVSCEVFEELTSDGTYLSGARKPRLVVYQNVHAANLLPNELLAGPYDEAWGEFGGQWAQISVGVHHNALPE